MLAFVMTYHKAQGMTCKNGVIMLSPPLEPEALKRIFQGKSLSYVGISRVVRTDGPSGLILLGPLVQAHFDLARNHRLMIESEYNRLRALPGMGQFSRVPLGPGHLAASVAAAALAQRQALEQSRAAAQRRAEDERHSAAAAAAAAATTPAAQRGTGAGAAYPARAAALAVFKSIQIQTYDVLGLDGNGNVVADDPSACGDCIVDPAGHHYISKVIALL